MLQTNGIRTINHQLSKSAIKYLHQEWKHFESKIDDYPNIFDGRGIVMCAGGVRYFTCAWITVHIIRRLGCHLPIEVWYHDNELTESCIEQLQLHNVTCKNFSDYQLPEIRGWQSKPFSIMYSSFKEVLFIDADNIPVRNPEELFEMNGYKETGAVFWPDFWETPKSNPIWSIVNVPYRKMKEQESGQILINKERCWRSLNVASYFNKEANVYYKILLGDKDTYRFSWLALGVPFFMIEQEPGSCGYIDKDSQFMGHTMLQYDENSTLFFLHRNLLKWDITFNDEKAWVKIKKFDKHSVKREYLNGYSKVNGHPYMDFAGDYTVYDFHAICGDIENMCLNILRDLRETIFYRDLLIENYIKTRRPREQFISSVPLVRSQ